MSDGLVIIPSKGDGYVELAKTKQGRLFKKHILNFGTLYHPKTKEPITIDDTFAATLKKNFDNGVCDIVQVPLANKNNEHSENPKDNVGEVVDLQIKDKKVYAVIDVRDTDAANKFGSTYLGASAMLHLDYEDTKTNTRVGPTLLHSCVTNRPYVTGLEPYEEIVAATSDRADGEAVVLLSDDEPAAEPPSGDTTEEQDMPEEQTTSEPTPQKPSLAELFETLKADHGIDVPGLQNQAAENTAAASLSQKLTEALADAGLVNLTATDGKDAVASEDVVGAVAELAHSNVELTTRLTKLEEERADAQVQADIDNGFVLPAKKDHMVKLKLANPALYADLLPDQPLLKLSNEVGKTPPRDESHQKDLVAEVERYAKMAATGNGRP